MSKCDLDKCQLTDDVAEIKTAQQETHDSTIRMEESQKSLVKSIDKYIEQGGKDHAELFKRTRWVVTWKALGLTAAGLLTATATIVGVVWTFAGGN